MTIEINIENLNPERLSSHIIKESRMHMAKRLASESKIVDLPTGNNFQVYVTSPCVDKYGHKNSSTTFITILEHEDVIEGMKHLKAWHEKNVFNPNHYDHDRD